MSKLCAAGAWKRQRLPHRSSGHSGHREWRGKGRGKEGSRDRNIFRTERQEASIICQGTMSARFGSPGRVVSGQGGTGGKVKILTFNS